MHFVSISLLIVFVLWLNYQIAKSNRISRKGIDEFWNKESQANLTRKADISSLTYITIPFEKLPLEDNPDQTINSYRDTILSHSGKKILNLSGLSNTELKLKYGTSNIKLLSEYDINYTVVISMLHKWGERLLELGFVNEAIAVLEVALDCHSDSHKTYELLAKIYIEQGSNKINPLIDRISSANIRDKENLLLKIQAQINSL